MDLFSHATFSLALGQMGKMFIYIVFGYIIRKVGIVTDKAGKDLGAILLWGITPAYIVRNLANNVNIDNLLENGLILLFSVLSLAIAYPIARFLAARFNKDYFLRGIYEFMFLLTNITYVGYPITEAVFGEQMLAYLIVFALPYTVVIYTWGISRINPKQGFSLKKIMKPPTIALFAGAAIGIANIPIPPMVDGVLSGAAGCLTPLAMMLTGIVFARRPLLKMLTQPAVYLACILRLAVLPAAFGAAAYFLGVPARIVIVGTMALAMPVSLSTVIFSESSGGDSTLAAQLCIVSNLIGLFTIPVVCSLLGMIL